MGRASSSSSSDSSSSSSRERKKRKRDKEKKHKRKRKSESKKRRKREDDPERERLKEARRLLKRRTRAADEALVPSAAAEKKRKPNDAAGGLALPGAAGETPLTAAQEAAARVAAARAAALQEDAALERRGAPREDVLGFRNASIAGLAGLDADAAAPGTVGASSFDARRARQKKAAERLEALLPAPATGREALFEKRAAARASNREMANAKEEGMFASGFGGELGGGGADEFRAALAANRMKREARNRRRGVDGASAALRLREHRRLEAEKMGAFQDMVGGLGEGERIEIPRRE
jgi:hypothetical protein